MPTCTSGTTCSTSPTLSNVPRPHVTGLISHAQALGYQVVLYVVSVDDPKRLLARVSQRVEEGGHHVPPDRIL